MRTSASSQRSGRRSLKNISHFVNNYRKVKEKMKVSGRQVAGARGLLNWSQDQLALAADVTKHTIMRWETGAHEPRESTMRQVIRAIEERGVEFTNGGQPGVRFKAKPETERGTSAD